MSTRPAPRTGAAASATVIRSDAVRRRPPSSPVEQLEDFSGRLDVLIRDIRLGPTSHREHDRHVAEAEAIAAGIRAAFREPTRARPVHPPLAMTPGKAWW